MGLILLAQAAAGAAQQTPPGAWSAPVPFWQVAIVVGGMVSALAFLAGWIKILYSNIQSIKSDIADDRESLLKELSKERDEARKETISTLIDKSARLEQVAGDQANTRNAMENLTVAVKELTREVRSLDRG